jgi:diaminohydroxyphosphoribosylaminopyrimidine deaminase / 5-amino-6-(5-phosphoribosylamino)uracil reductase
MSIRSLTKDELYMQRAFDLAEGGRGKVSPNPMVGCVIVKNDKIIGEGFHMQYGGPHAEVNAINSVINKENLQDAVLYVTLEPCAHHGKTPPCANLIISYPFKKVVISNSDPNPLVAGKGIEKLISSKIEVVQGILKEEGREFNRRFFSFIEKKRPYIILKWAETADGFIAREDFSSKWISNEFSRKIVHKWRAEEDAVMVGTNTALYDNPKLNVRDWKGGNPLRIFIDKDLRISQGNNLYDGSQPTLCYNSIKSEKEDNFEFIKIEFAGNIINTIVKDLHSRNVQSLIVEGGSQLLKGFLGNGLWDEVRLFKSTEKFKKGISGPEFSGKLSSKEMIGGDELLIYKSERNKELAGK